MVRSKSMLWITFAFCVTTGSCTDFIKQIGDEVVMDCSNPDLNDIVWKWNNNLLLGKKRSGNVRKGGLDTSRARIDGTSLKITQLKKSDSGDYTCGSSKHRLYLASAHAIPSSVLISSDINLSCDVTSGFTGTFQWHFPNSSKYSKGKDVTVKSVNSGHAGNWACDIRNKKNENLTLYVDISVVGPLHTSAEITISEWGNAELPCFLPALSKLPITGGSWTRNPPSGIRLPALEKTESGLKWNETSVSTDKVTFNKQILNQYFNVTLKKVKQADSGVYVCSLEFEGGKSLSASVNLTVLKSDGVPPDMNSGNSKLNMWHKRVWGMQLWIWIAIATSSFILISLVTIILLIHFRNKRMKRKMKTQRSMQQPLTSRNYCKCGRPSVTAMQQGAGKRERPPPLPRHQYSSLNE